MVDVSSIRSELQIPVALVTDEDIYYAINKVSNGDFNLICAQVLQMILNKNRGRKKVKIGNVSEEFDLQDIRDRVKFYRTRSARFSFDDGVAHPEPYFTRNGI